MTYESTIESPTGVLAGDLVSKRKKERGYQVLPYTMNRRMGHSIGRRRHR